MYEWFRAHYDVLVVLFAIGNTIPLAMQAGAIWFKKSGKAASIIWFSYTFFLAICNYLYGLSMGDTLIRVNGMFRTFVHIPVLFGLLVNKKVTKTEVIVFILLFLYIIVMLQFPLYAWWFYLTMSLVLVAATLRQREEIIDGKSVGVVKCEVIMLRICGNLFWTVYGLIARRFIVAFVAFVNLLAYIYTWKAWRKYRK